MPEIEFRIESSTNNGRVAVVENHDDYDNVLVLRTGSGAHRGWVDLTRSEALALAGALSTVANTLEEE